MASYPTFDPNDFGSYSPESWRNRAIADVYEPGSTFKIVTAAAALEAGVVRENDRIDCGDGHRSPSSATSASATTSRTAC